MENIFDKEKDFYIPKKKEYNRSFILKLVFVFKDLIKNPDGILAHEYKSKISFMETQNKDFIYAIKSLKFQEVRGILRNMHKNYRKEEGKEKFADMLEEARTYYKKCLKEL